MGEGQRSSTSCRRADGTKALEQERHYTWTKWNPLTTKMAAEPSRLSCDLSFDRATHSSCCRGKQIKSRTQSEADKVWSLSPSPLHWGALSRRLRQTSFCPTLHGKWIPQKNATLFLYWQNISYLQLWIHHINIYWAFKHHCHLRHAEMMFIWSCIQSRVYPSVHCIIATKKKRNALHQVLFYFR